MQRDDGFMGVGNNYSRKMKFFFFMEAVLSMILLGGWDLWVVEEYCRREISVWISRIKHLCFPSDLN